MVGSVICKGTPDILGWYRWGIFGPGLIGEEKITGVVEAAIDPMPVD